jgi:hypothetical protein
MTDYMFDSHRSLFLRGLSLFHGWLPFLLLFLVIRLGYDRRALLAWTSLAWGAILISYFFLPAPGATLTNPLAPVNIDYVYGFSDTAAQTWMPGWAWLIFLIVECHWLFSFQHICYCVGSLLTRPFPKQSQIRLGGRCRDLERIYQQP